MKCFYCGRDIDPADPGLWERVTAWRHKARYGKRRGGTDYKHAEPEGQLAHATCVQRDASGIAPAQESLI